MFRSIVHLKDSMKTTARRIPKKKSPEKVPHSLEHTSIRTHSQPHTHSHMHSATPSITHSTHAQSAHRLVQSSSKSSMRSPTPQQLYSKRNPSKPLISKAKLLTLATTSIGLATFFTRATPSIPPPTQAREPTFTDHIPRLSKYDLFFYACQNGDTEKLNQLLEDGMNVNRRHKYGWTALMVACMNHQYNIAKILLRHGADPNAGDRFTNSKTMPEKLIDFSELFQATRARSTEFSKEVSPDEKYTGYTALHYAVLADSVPIINLLFDYGVDSSIQSESGITADSIASSLARTTIETRRQQQLAGQDQLSFQKETLRDKLTKKLVGQSIAIDQVTGVISCLETKWINEKHPLVLLFIGATGLGKTEMAKQLAEYLRGNMKDAFIHINLSEYQTKHEAAKFTGAPPGYVGFGSGGNEGQLVTLLLKNPHAVVLFDEADKAHPDILAALLQLFDEGRLTGGSGKTVECQEALFVLTANLATEKIKAFSSELREKAKQGTEGGCDSFLEKKVHEFKTELLHDDLKEAFKRDELLGRINEVAIFVPFSVSELRQLVTQQLEQVRKRAAQIHGITLSWNDEVLNYLAGTFNETYGARNMKYEIERQIVSGLSKAKDMSLYKPGDFLHLYVLRLTDPDGQEREVIRLDTVGTNGITKNLNIHFDNLSQLFPISHH